MGGYSQQVTEPALRVHEGNARNIVSRLFTVPDDDLGRLKIGALTNELNAILAAQRTKKMFDATILVEKGTAGQLEVMLGVQDVRTQCKAVFESEAAALFNAMMRATKRIQDGQITK